MDEELRFALMLLIVWNVFAHNVFKMCKHKLIKTIRTLKYIINIRY